MCIGTRRLFFGGGFGGRGPARGLACRVPLATGTVRALTTDFALDHGFVGVLSVTSERIDSVSSIMMVLNRNESVVVVVMMGLRRRFFLAKALYTILVVDQEFTRRTEPINESGFLQHQSVKPWKNLKTLDQPWVYTESL